jgi:tRNA (cytidine/uridine-2'-O-)-methyltransferase
MAMNKGPQILHIVLVEPEIHWNTGNVGRTCLAVGAQLHLVRPLGFKLEDRRVKRAGLDYWPRVAPRVWTSFDEIETRLPELGEPFFLSPRAEKDIWSVRFPRRTVLLLGRESIGFSSEIRARFAERLVGIPMADDGVRSLNLSTAAAIAIYEVMRQWRATEDEIN